MFNITTIYKKKGSKHNLEKDRGVFGLSVFKKIIDKLIYQEIYPLVDEGMSDSNSIDKVGKYSQENGHHFKYKNYPLGHGG